MLKANRGIIWLCSYIYSQSESGTERIKQQISKETQDEDALSSISTASC